ncbi:hypothetical protein [Paenibacillus andongensis]|uniref:hypothetical protein n=1 Tax=Paenibacillus andongensis TaxID=2975482 RepID=UPI0021BB762D|nr:hypothetical protein [Paenibacillus andongensis]
MTFIVVDRSRFRGFEGTAKKLSGDVRRVHDDLISTGRNMDWDIRSSAGIDRTIAALNNDLEKQADVLNKLAAFFVHALQEYEKLDKEQLAEIQKVVDPTVVTPQNQSIVSDILKWFGTSNGLTLLKLGLLSSNPGLASLLLSEEVIRRNLLGNNSPTTKDTNDSYHAYKKENIGKNGKTGIYAGGYELDDKSVKAYVGKASASGKYGITEGEVNTYVGKTEANWDAHAGLWTKDYNETTKKWETGKFNPNLTLEGGVEVDLIEAEAKGKVGNDDLALIGEAKGTVGSAEAKAGIEFDLQKLELDAKGSLKASAFAGEVKGGFEILGYEIGIKLKGDALSVGVEGEAQFDVERQKFKIGGSASALFGAGLELEIGKK